MGWFYETVRSPQPPFTTRTGSFSGSSHVHCEVSGVANTGLLHDYECCALALIHSNEIMSYSTSYKGRKQG